MITKPTSPPGGRPSTPDAAVPNALKDRSDALEQQAQDLVRSAEMVCQQMLTYANERIEVLEKQARELTGFVETTRQQSQSKADKKIKALEQKVRDLSDFVETLRNQARLQSKKEIEALRQKALDLAAVVETDYKKTVAMNEALLLGSLHQHELTEAADLSNAQLQAEISVRKQAEGALHRAQSQLMNHAGQLEGLVTERTSELTASNEQLEAFVYSIAHDLRAPLRAMQGFSVMLMEDKDTVLSEAGRDFANRINKSAQFMDALLQDLLVFSSVAQQQIELTSVNLETIIRSALSHLGEKIQVKNARVECAGPWPSVLAHESTLGQVLTNLVSNALKFVRPDMPPRIRLRAEQPGRFVRVWVEDNGIGIAPDYQAQIFRLFTRLQGEKFPGTGIGLAIVRKGIERMGGRVGVESIPGEGSHFWFELQKARKNPPV